MNLKIFSEFSNKVYELAIIFNLAEISPGWEKAYCGSQGFNENAAGEKSP